jgi:hypothetical protein
MPASHPADPHEGGATPLMTATQIRSALDLNHSLFVERDGLRYYVGEDEEGNGFFAWPAPTTKRADHAHAIASFGGCDPSEVPGDWSIDYTALSERIAAWLTGGADV